jgi:hypothetical protein
MQEPADREAARERESGQGFLAFLNSDRSEGGLSQDETIDVRAKRYVEIHARLMRLFAWRGCHEPELLADRALDRAKQAWGKRDPIEKKQSDMPNPIGFVCSFVRFVFLEWLAEQRTPELPQSTERSDVDEVALECLDHCLEAALDPEDRKLICEYYEGQKRAKIDHRKAVADKHNLSVNALRIETCRLRRRLRTCIVACIRRKRPEIYPAIGAVSSIGKARA